MGIMGKIAAKVGGKLIDTVLTGGAAGTIGQMANSLIGLIPNKNLQREMKQTLDLEKLGQEWRVIHEKNETEQKMRDALKEENLGQMAINLEDAKSDKWYQNGWRPACGWVGAFALFYATFGDSIFGWISFWQGLIDAPPPPADTQFIQLVLLGMLGLRGTEKYFQSRVPDTDSVKAEEIERLQKSIEKLERMIERLRDEIEALDAQIQSTPQS